MSVKETRPAGVSPGGMNLAQIDDRRMLFLGQLNGAAMKPNLSPAEERTLTAELVENLLLGTPEEVNASFVRLGATPVELSEIARLHPEPAILPEKG